MVCASILFFSKYENSHPINLATFDALSIAPLSGLNMKSGKTSFLTF